MSICRRSHVAVVLGCAVAALSLLRCAPTNACLRITDCDVGFACVAGECAAQTATSSDVEGGAGAEGGESDASRAGASDATTAAAAATEDAAASATDGAKVEGGGSTDLDAGDETEIDTADF